MKSVSLALLVSATLLFAFGCNKPGTENTNQRQPSAASSPAAKTTPDEFATARATFKKNCSVCHGEEGTGGLKTVEGKKLKVPNFREGHALKHPDEDFIKQINNGGEGMPKFKDKLSPEEINDLVRFIRHEFQGK